MLSDLTHRVPGAEGNGKSSIGIDIEFRSLEKLWFSAYFYWNREEGSILGWAKLVFFVILEHENAYQKQKNTPKIAVSFLVLVIELKTLHVVLPRM